MLLINSLFLMPSFLFQSRHAHPNFCFWSQKALLSYPNPPPAYDCLLLSRFLIRIEEPVSALHASLSVLQSFAFRWSFLK
jgi:hypothetical protein